MTKKLLILLLLCVTCALHAANYLTFTAEADSSSFGIHSEWGNNPDVQYSLDGGKTWAKLTNDTLIPLPNKKKALLRGYNPQGISRDFGEVTRFVMTGRIAASGSVMSLIDNVGESVVIPNDGCFKLLFMDCASLKKAPELPAVHLTERCYMKMFLRCKNLTVAPKLPATQLADGCYSGMFRGCIHLKKAPELPATHLENRCYESMFVDCIKLTKAPELPARRLAYECYGYMFSGCTYLTEAPKLPAIHLNGSCYQGMFHNCTSLTKIPELPATKLWNNCYRNMFSGCSSLKEAPELPATQLADECYSGMFRGCICLIKAPELPATTLTKSCYENMFRGCTQLSEIKVRFTDWGEKWKATDHWLDDVAIDGTFICPNELSKEFEGDKIPEIWTVVVIKK